MPKRKYESDSDFEEEDNYEQFNNVKSVKKRSKKEHSKATYLSNQITQGLSIEYEDEDHRSLSDDDNMNAAEEPDGDIKYNEDGIPITPFNLQEEKTEGYFDKNGHYVERNPIRDAWLDEYDDNRQKTAQFIDHSQTYMPQKSLKTSKIPKNSDIDYFKQDSNNLLTTLLSYMISGETLPKTLFRLRGQLSETKSTSNKHQPLLPTSASSDSTDNKPKHSQTVIPYEFTVVSQISDALLAKGYYDIYTDNYEMIKKKIEKTEKSVENVPEAILWEYKTSQSNDNIIHGPFPSTLMGKWLQQGYFNDPNLDIYVRTAARNILEEPGEWKNFNNISWNDYL